MNLDITSKSEAKALGVKRYFTGKPCKRGHIAQRYVSRSGCTECSRLDLLSRYAANPERERERARRRRLEGLEAFRLCQERYRRKNKHRLKDIKDAWRKKNARKINRQQSDWDAANPEKRKRYERKYCEGHRKVLRERSHQYRQENAEKVKKAQNDYRLENLDKRAANEALRRSRKLQRIPSWADIEAIRFFYECRPKGCHVDHVIPLRGQLISGLHVETNLQWMPASENHKKSNTWKG